MKVINYKRKNWKGSVIFPEETLETCNYPEQVLRLQKERQNVKYDKKQKFIYFFLWKTGVEANKLITNSLKTLDFVTLIPLTPSLDKNNVIFYP